MEFCKLLSASHLNNLLRKTLKLGWVAFHSVTFYLKCLDFQCNQYKKLVPVLSRFCNRPRSIYQYSSIASRLSGQNYKFFKFLLSSNSQKRLRYKENNTKYRSLTRKPRSHVRILIYRTWPMGYAQLTLSPRLHVKPLITAIRAICLRVKTSFKTIHNENVFRLEVHFYANQAQAYFHTKGFVR